MSLNLNTQKSVHTSLHDMKIGFESRFETQKAKGHNVFSSALSAVFNAHHDGKAYANIKSDLGEVKYWLDAAKVQDEAHKIDLAVNFIKQAKHKMTETKINLNAQHLSKSVQDKVVDQLQKHYKYSKAIKKDGEIGHRESVKNFTEAFVEGPNSKQNTENLFNKMMAAALGPDENATIIRDNFLRASKHFIAKDIGSTIKSDHPLEEIENLIKSDNALTVTQFNEFGTAALKYLNSIGPNISAEVMVRITDTIVTPEVTDVDQIDMKKLTEECKILIDSWKTTLGTDQLLVIEKLCDLFTHADSIENKNQDVLYSTLGFQLGSMLQENSGETVSKYRESHNGIRHLVNKYNTKTQLAMPLEPIQSVLGQVLMESFAPAKEVQ